MRLRLQLAGDIAAYADVVASMTAGGAISAWLGAGVLQHMPVKQLMNAIALILLLISVMLVVESVSVAAPSNVLPEVPAVRMIVGLFAGLGVGVVSSLLGVAGGEFIIPILIFIFGADVKAAGSLSLLISIPVVTMGVIKHRSTGHYRSTEILRYLVLPMGLGSVLGAVLGGLAAAAVWTGAMKGLLAIVLAYSALKLQRQAR